MMKMQPAHATLHQEGANAALLTEAEWLTSLWVMVTDTDTEAFLLASSQYFWVCIKTYI